MSNTQFCLLLSQLSMLALAMTDFKNGALLFYSLLWGAGFVLCMFVDGMKKLEEDKKKEKS